VVNVLLRKDESIAFRAVITLFLRQTVQLWLHSGLFGASEVIKSYIRDEAFGLPEEPNAASRALLDCFTDTISIPAPKIGRISFINGVHFAMTVVDSVLMRQFGRIGCAGRTGKPPVVLAGDRTKALRDAFSIRTSINDQPQKAFQLPSPPAHPDEIAQLEFAKQFHETLFAVSGDIRHFESLVDATRRVLALEALRLAAASNDVTGEDRHRQISLFVNAFFERRFLPDVRSFVDRNKISVTTELGAAVYSRLAKGEPVSRAILNGTVEYANTLRQRVGSGLTPIVVEVKDEPFVESFAEAADRFAFSRAVAEMSRQSITIGMGKESAVSRWVEQRALAPAMDGNLDWEQAEAASADLKCLMPHLASVFKFMMRSRNADRTKGTGGRLLMFLEIEESLRLVFDDDVEGFEYEFLTKIFDSPDDPRQIRLLMYFRAFLLQAITGALEWSDAVGVKRIAALENLAKWFCLKFPPE
jgi:hypothetical protein